MCDQIEVENINVPGYVCRVDKAKYEAMRRVLLEVLPKRPPGMTHKQIVEAIKPQLPEDLWPGGSKATWWSKTVQLDLEAKGLVIRDDKAKPMRWYKA